MIILYGVHAHNQVVGVVIMVVVGVMMVMVVYIVHACNQPV